MAGVRLGELREYADRLVDLPGVEERLRFLERVFDGRRAASRTARLRRRDGRRAMTMTAPAKTKAKTNTKNTKVTKAKTGKTSAAQRPAAAKTAKKSATKRAKTK